MPTRRLLVLIAANFFVATSFMSVGGLLSEIAADLRIPIEQAGLLIAAFGITAAICAPTLATVGSHIDRRRLLTATMVIGAIANLCAAFSETYGQLMVARILAAITSAVYTPQVAATVSLLVSEDERAATLAKLMMGVAIGSVVGAPLAVLVGTSYGWRVSFEALGVATAVIAILMWQALPSGVKVTPLSVSRWYQVFTSPALRWLIAATVCMSIGITILQSFLSPLVKAVQGITGPTLAGLFFVAGVGGLTGSLLSVRLVRRLGATRIAHLSAITFGTTLLVWPFGSRWVVGIFIMQFVCTIGIAGFSAVQQSRLVAVAPALAAATIALNSSMTYFGSFVGASVGAAAWAVVEPRFLPWAGLVFIVVALLSSIRGDAIARQLPRTTHR
jgi:MFS transporter, DHA1 family, inner membrane transport protein